MFRVFLFTLVLAAFVCCDDEIKEEEDVIVATTANFKTVVTDESQVLVEFYAPWCGHCQSLAPEYAKAAGTLKEENSPIKLAKVDATVEKELAEKYEVKGFPTIKFFNKGNVIDFAGGRTGKDIVDWLKKKTGPPAKSLDTADDLKAFTTLEGARDIVVVGTFNGESDAKKAYLDAAAAIEGLEFGIAVGENDAIAVHKSFDNEDKVPILMSGDLTDVQAIKDFAKSESMRLLTEFSDETAPKIFGGDIKNHLLAFVSKKADEFKSHEAALTEVAKSFKNKILFVYINVDVTDNERILEFFNLKKADVPTVRIIDLSTDMKKYNPTENKMDAAAISAFATSFLNKELKPHLNTEEVPADWDSKPVKVLVGKNFLEVAGDKSKNVFVEFYAPWCGHCKQLAPIWDELAEALADRDDIIIAKMDSTANEVEEVQVQSFPTLKCWKKGDGEVVDYKGARTKEALKKFAESGCEIQEEATEPEEDPMAEEGDDGEEPEGEEPEGEESEGEESEGEEPEAEGDEKPTEDTKKDEL